MKMSRTVLCLHKEKMNKTTAEFTIQTAKFSLRNCINQVSYVAIVTRNAKAVSPLVYCPQNFHFCA